MEIIINSNNISFTIKDKEINGILGNHLEDFIEILYLSSKSKIFINNKDIKENIIPYQKKIKIVRDKLDTYYLSKKVYECMYLEIKDNNYYLKDPKKKIIDTLKLVGLDITYMTRNISDLSSSEKKLLQIGIALMANPEVIILQEPFKCLDKKNERRISILLRKMKEKYDKTIVILSNDSNILYKYTTHLIIEKSHKVLIEGNTEDCFTNIELLEKEQIKIPDIVEFTYLAQRIKNAKIDYHKDIRDIIKDIYKHV